MHVKKGSSGQTSEARKPRPCIRCGACSHEPPNCPHKNSTCFKCQKRGHLAASCLGGKKQGKPNFQANAVTVSDEVEVAEQVIDIFTVTSTATTSVVKPVYRTLSWGGELLRMQIDTGSSVCIISEDTYRTHANQWPKLEKTGRELRCYLGQLPVCGILNMTVEHQVRQMAAELFVVKCSGPAFCGRDVILGLGLMHDIHVGAVLASTEDTSATTTKLKADFKDLFQSGTGLMRGPPVNIALKKDANPRFLKACSLPYALRNKVAAELERMCQQGILTPISHSKWATPIVPVVKPDETLRICGDFKV